jgi:hypothetical protein
MTLAEARTVLGVDPTATPDQIRSAFRALARTMHPDVGGDTATFARINAAYDVLSGKAAAEPERSAPSRPARTRPPATPANQAIRIFSGPMGRGVMVSVMGRPAFRVNDARQMALEILYRMGMQLDDAMDSGSRYGVEISVVTLPRPVKTNLATMLYDICAGGVNVLTTDMGATLEDEMPEWEDE